MYKIRMMTAGSATVTLEGGKEITVYYHEWSRFKYNTPAQRDQAIIKAARDKSL